MITRKDLMGFNMVDVLSEIMNSKPAYFDPDNDIIVSARKNSSLNSRRKSKDSGEGSEVVCASGVIAVPSGDEGNVTVSHVGHSPQVSGRSGSQVEMGDVGQLIDADC